MVFAEVPVTRCLEDLDLPCPSAQIAMPGPLASGLPVQDADKEEGSEEEVDEAVDSEQQDDIEVLLVHEKPTLQQAAQRKVEPGMDKLAEKLRAGKRCCSCPLCC